MSCFACPCGIVACSCTLSGYFLYNAQAGSLCDCLLSLPFVLIFCHWLHEAFTLVLATVVQHLYVLNSAELRRVYSTFRSTLCCGGGELLTLTYRILVTRPS